MPQAQSSDIHGDPHARLTISSRGVPPDEAAGAVVLLHGRGRTANGILALSARLAVPDMAYLAPQAAGRTWYPNRFLAPIAENEPALSSALRAIDRIVTKLGVSGIGPEQIVFLGFSQGACLAVEYVARRPRRYGGAAVLIGGLFGPLGSRLSHDGSLAGTPVFLWTPDPDPFVPPVRVRETAQVLHDMDAHVTMRVQEGAGHVITGEGLAGALAIIQAVQRSRPARPAASSFDAKAPRQPQARATDRPTRIHPSAH